MIRITLTVLMVLLIGACDDSTISPSDTSANSIAGTVLFDPTGLPAAGVGVVLERCAGSMMGGDRWDMLVRMQTDEHGRFHFEYHYSSMHRYRVGVPNMSDWHPCDGSFEDNVVLRIPQ